MILMVMIMINCGDDDVDAECDCDVSDDAVDVGAIDQCCSLSSPPTLHQRYY